MKLFPLLNGENWCANASARSADGKPVEPESQSAVRWDLVAWLKRVYPIDRERIPVYTRLRENVGMSLGPWNDKVGFATVLAKLRELDI